MDAPPQQLRELSLFPGALAPYASKLVGDIEDIDALTDIPYVGKKTAETAKERLA